MRRHAEKKTGAKVGQCGRGHCVRGNARELISGEEGG